jgi:hypothetical protein
MSYYGSDIEAAEAESSFDDPSAELESQAEADDPEGDLGDGALDPRKRKRLPTDYEPARVRAMGRIAG